MLDVKRSMQQMRSRVEGLPGWIYPLLGILAAMITRRVTDGWLDNHETWALWIFGAFFVVLVPIMIVHLVRETRAIRAAHRRGERRR
jgi:hypothetical protein